MQIKIALKKILSTFIKVQPTHEQSQNNANKRIEAKRSTTGNVFVNWLHEEGNWFSSKSQLVIGRIFIEVAR